MNNQPQQPLYPADTASYVAPAAPPMEEASKSQSYAYPPNPYPQQQQQHPYPPPQNGSHPIYIPPGHQGPVYVVQENKSSGGMPIGLILFIAGFFTAVAWWIGACCYPNKNQMNEKEKLWRRINIVMTIVSLLLIIVFVVLYGVLLGFTFTTAASTVNTANTRAL